jgi:hypothetical protein
MDGVKGLSTEMIYLLKIWGVAKREPGRTTYGIFGRGQDVVVSVSAGRKWSIFRV